MDMKLSYDNQGEFSKKLFIETYGCQMNVADSEVVASVMKMAGYDTTDTLDAADAIFINTCSIRDNAEQKIFSRLNQLNALRRNRKRRLIVGIIGCMAERLKEVLINEYDVDIVAGPDSYLELPNLIASAEAGEKAIETTLSTTETYRDIIPQRISGNKVSGYISIMRGCNNFCTYCIIPYARGRVRSLPVEQALEQTARLADAGVHEIVLTGIEIASYGKDFKPQVPLTELLEKLLTAQPNVQFRLGSLDPRAVDDAFCERLAGFANLARHFHLSMQSGCDTVLRRMNRHYTSEEFYRCVERLRRAFPDCSVTTDLIVGFPGETEDEFTQTLAFLERCAFASVHVFPYSVREGTKAAAMPGQLDQQTKTARAERAKQVAETLSAAYRKQFVGRTLYALPEHPTGGLWAAHGRYGFPVYIEDKAEKNHPVTVKVIGLHKDGVLAKFEN